MANYFVRNLETGKIELHFDRVTYQALPQQKKDAIKGAFLWAKSRGAWVSRTTRNNWRAESIAKDLGLEDRGEEGEKLTYAEQVEAKTERAEARADRMEARADKASDEASSRFKAAHAISDGIPFGQPILVGHHSERRHRRDIAKIENNMNKGCAALDRSKHYDRRAAAARSTASQKQLSDAGYLMRRIKENEAEERRLLRLADQAVQDDKPEWMDRLCDYLGEVRDKLSFFRACLDDCGGLKYGKHNVKPGDLVFIRGQWEEVVRANPTTVAVPNICFQTPESQRKWALKYGWGEVKDHKPKAS